MVFRVSSAIAVLLVSAGSAAFAGPAGRPTPPPVKPVTESFYGVTVTDPYRYMENEKDQSVIDWMKAEGRYTRAVLDSVPAHAALLKRIGDFTSSFDFVKSIQKGGGRTFYEERAPGSDNFDLLVRDANGKVRKLVDVSAIRAAHAGTPYAINYFVPSFDGTKVAVGISQGGSEDASLFVYDVASGKQIADPLPLAQYGAVAWTPENDKLFVNLLNPLAPGEDSINKYKNSKVYFWDFKGKPSPVLGTGVPGPITFKPDESPFLQTTPDTQVALAFNINGVQNEAEVWTAPVAAAESANAPWKKLISREDGLTNLTSAGQHLYLLSHKDAPTFQVLSLEMGQPLSMAKVIVAAQPGRLIESISAAKDGLYVRSRRGVYSELTRVPLTGGAEQAITLPVKGSISELFADPREPGAVLLVDSWTVPPTVLAYDPAKGFTDLKMGKSPAGFEPSLYAVEDLRAKAKDGVQVPLSYITTKGAKHPRPVLLWAYGSYGISQFPGFGARTIAAVTSGVDYAVCHVRGGGELGEAWRLGGKDANKPNTWRDLIACGEDLIARGYTTKAMLFIGGGSAGGITMGRAMEERPDLFAGVFDLVPAANATRQEFSPNGPGNTPEFGTVANEQGFKYLYAMDSVLHVEPGKHYPPIMITTGLNDPRVASWEPAKLAATLRASDTTNPVFLRVDEKAGHGIGSTRSQSDELYADVITFIKWRSGEAGWAPTIPIVK